MAITNRATPSYIQRQFNGNALDWDAASIKATLHTSAIALNTTALLAGVDFFDDVASSELAAGGGYTAGGAAVAVAAVTYDATTRQVRLTVSAPTVWNPITKTGIRYIVVRRDTGTNSTSEVICVIDLETDQTVDGTLTVNWDATGVGRLTLPA